MVQVYATPPTVTMEFRETFSREFLAGVYEKHRAETRLNTIQRFVEQMCAQVVQSAMLGKTRHMIEVRNERATGWTGEQYVPTNEDLIEGFRAKFPGCNVQYEESWVTLPRTPNQMHKKSGIIVDWS